MKRLLSCGRRGLPASLVVAVCSAGVIAAQPAVAGGKYTPDDPPVEYQEPYAYSAGHDWTGAYMGGSVGYAFRGHDRVGLNTAGTNVGTLRNDGAFAGIHLGVNNQTGNFVWGFEGDFQLGNIGDTVTDGTNTARTEFDYVATARARAGVAMGDSGLGYVTGGVSLAKIDYRVNGPAVGISETFTKGGYSVGAGYEHALEGSWSLRGEYRYNNYGSKTLSGGGDSTRATPDFHALSMGLSHRF